MGEPLLIALAVVAAVVAVVIAFVLAEGDAADVEPSGGDASGNPEGDDIEPEAAAGPPREIPGHRRRVLLRALEVAAVVLLVLAGLAAVVLLIVAVGIGAATYLGAAAG